MAHSVLVKFDSVLIDEMQIVLKVGCHTFVLPYRRIKDVTTYHGLEFDFVSFYALGKEPKSLSMAWGEVELNGDLVMSQGCTETIEFLEGVCHDRIDYRIEGEEDLRVINHLKGSISSIVFK